MAEPESPETIQPMVDEIVTALEDLATKYYQQGKKRDIIDACTGWAYTISDQLPMCCAGHRIERLGKIQQEMHMSVHICKQFGCGDEEMHKFIVSLVRIIGDAGHRLLLHRELEHRRN